jgi:hypothetical protein
MESDEEAVSATAKPQPGDYSLRFFFFCVLINVVLGTAYVPPHLRNRPQDEAGSEAMIKLTRQIKGLLNRFVLF